MDSLEVRVQMPSMTKITAVQISAPPVPLSRGVHALANFNYDEYTDHEYTVCGKMRLLGERTGPHPHVLSLRKWSL